MSAIGKQFFFTRAASTGGRCNKQILINRQLTGGKL
jgi:hypothetical protein